MIDLSLRLKAVADLVRRDSYLADIGCDHGFLPVYLLQCGKIKGAVASDINKGPLERCRALVEQYDLSAQIQCVLSDGLSKIRFSELQDIAVCGMGGELIASILEQCPYSKTPGVHYIFNPMTHPEKLRAYLCNNGYEIGSDLIVRDGNHAYSVLDAYYTGAKKDYPPAYYFLGNIRDFSDKNYFRSLLHYLKNKQKGGADYTQVIQEIEARL